MAKYLWEVSHTQEGVKGLLKEGGSSRRATIEKLVEGMGGKMEAMYYAFGERDLIAIVDLPDNITAAAISLVANAAGSVQARTTVLITPEEIDEATKKTVDYRPPGA